MRTLRILIVDDDRDLGASLGDLLRFDGHVVDLVYTGGDGIQAAADNDYDLIFMDIVLPDMSGVDSALTIQKAKPNVNVLLMTGYSADYLNREAIVDHGIEILTKPLDVEGLLRRLFGFPEQR